MARLTWSLAALAIAASWPAAWPPPQAPKKLPDGVYEVLRDSLKEKDVLPLRTGEVLAVHQHRYSRPADKEPPRFLVLRSTADVPLDLAGPPQAEKQERGDQVVRILLKLRPKAASALEKLTTACQGRQIAIVLGGEVATMHKVRQVIRDGRVQITACAEGAMNYLLEELRAHWKGEKGNS